MSSDILCHFGFSFELRAATWKSCNAVTSSRALKQSSSASSSTASSSTASSFVFAQSRSPPHTPHSPSAMSQLPPPSEKPQISQEDQEIDAPLVFQCIHCNTIVADSFAWFESQQALNTITLYGEPFGIVGACFPGISLKYWK